ncbi:MAG: IclR family transcriptional regulator [Acidimicrobiia bacterium]|nr:IclR family transcriptional regulator [Acidimicrobiia bacterium]
MTTVQSIHRAFVVMQQLASASMGVTELALACDLPKSTVSRLLRTLEAEGAVEQAGDGGRWRIGPVIPSLAGSTAFGVDLVARARPHLALLAHETGEDAGLSVPDGYRVHYVAQVDSDNAVQVRDWTGELVPMHVVPSGLAMLAYWPSERIERYLRRSLERFTDATVVDPDRVRTRLEAIRAEGYVWVFEEFVEGINSVAAPILDRRGRPRAAIHIHGPAYRFPGEGEETAIAHLVVEKASAISERLESREG